jgi:glycosyltransferase involved in cell wall biosynthesis
MRIGLFTNNYRPLVNGLATSVETFARAFRAGGHQVSILAPRYPAGPPAESGVIRVAGIRAPTHHAYVLPLPWFPGLPRMIDALNLDVFHAQHPLLLGGTALRAARRAGRPLVFTYHTHYDRYVHYIPGPARLMAALAVRQAVAFANRADLVVAPAPAVARRLQGLGVRTPLAVVPTGVPTPPAIRAHRRDCLRAMLGVGAGGPLCLSVGRLAREKNSLFLLTAFAEVLRRLPAARLALVGDGDERSWLEAECRRLGLGRAVCFTGAVPREAVHEYYQAADLFLFASTSETQGLAALEALAAGLPVVAVFSDAAADLLRDAAAGILTPEAPEIFAESVVAIWNHHEAREAVRRAGRRVAARYTPDACAATLLGLYTQLCEERQRASARSRPPQPQEART